MLSGVPRNSLIAGLRAHHVRRFQDRRCRSGRDARVARVHRLGAAHPGAERAHYLLERVIDYTRRSARTAIPAEHGLRQHDLDRAGAGIPGDRALEKRIKAYIRWNAMAMVVQANRQSSEYGGHIASYASAATLYEVGFNHFCARRASSTRRHGVHAGHSSPGIYARAFLEGRSRAQLRASARRWRRRLSSYPTRG